MTEQLVVFSSIAAAIFLEAMPFLVIGAVLSAVMEVTLRHDRLARFIPRRFAGGVALGLGASLLIPTCECGVVPIVRRLIGKGVPPYVAIVYLLAAPILNPVVLTSTYIAFRGDLSLVLGRVVIAILVAVAVGGFVRRSPGPAVRSSMTRPGHDHAAGCDGDGHDSRHSSPVQILLHAAHDFLDMSRFLILGAVAAALFKTFLPDAVFDFLCSSPVLAVAGMMALAILLSVCSEADAFVAASFVAFPPAARLAFVAIGPMVDLKLIGMYGTTFSRRLFLALLIVPTLIVFVACLIFGWIT